MLLEHIEEALSYIWKVKEGFTEEVIAKRTSEGLIGLVRQNMTFEYSDPGRQHVQRLQGKRERELNDTLECIRYRVCGSG